MARITTIQDIYDSLSKTIDEFKWVRKAIREAEEEHEINLTDVSGAVDDLLDTVDDIKSELENFESDFQDRISDVKEKVRDYIEELID